MDQVRKMLDCRLSSGCLNHTQQLIIRHSVPSVVKTIFLEIPLAFSIAHIDVRVVVLPIPRLFHVYSTAIIAAFQFKLLLCILFLKLVLKRASLTKSA